MRLWCIFSHNWVYVKDVDHSICGHCFEFYKGCPHSFRVCRSCGEVKGFGSHGRLSVIPDGCKEQIKKMLRECCGRVP